jgi:hypothetical protein
MWGRLRAASAVSRGRTAALELPAVRTHVYIDGFNLYYGAVDGTSLKWLDIVKLCRRLLPDDTIERVHYCTALTKDTPRDPTKSTRQQMFIRALETFPEIRVTYGSFLATKRRCPSPAVTPTRWPIETS